MNDLSRRQSTAALTLAALGVVYGDIGTSPLYTIKEIFSPVNGVPLNPHTVVGAISVVIWALMAVVTLKYVTLVLRADNRGEGGILALLALAVHTLARRPRQRSVLLLLGMFGACLFYGDSVLTPAISVLSAVEGLEIATPALKPYVLPLSIGILAGLFVLQSLGTATVGRYFGPVIVLWFIVLAAAGLHQISQAPEIVQALDPRQALRFLAERGWGVFLAVGAVVLAITGAEALYADMGHFGRRPIRIAWTGLVLPSLALNYMGQGALLLHRPAAVENPFYRMFPPALLLPAVAIATLATIIASQAVISGAFSLTQQAIQLGLLPRMQIRHTSAAEKGQIYVPLINWGLLAAVAAACIGFGSSTAVASAYGVAVTATMLITTVLTWFVVRHAWGYPAWLAAAATGIFIALDALMVAACSVKLLEGGWFPLVLGLALLAVMIVWKSGRQRLTDALHRDQPPLADFVQQLASGPELQRVKRTAVFLSAENDVVPPALLHNMKHNQVVHERNVILTVRFHEDPWIGFDKRVAVEPLGASLWRVTLNYGFMNQPDIPRALELCAAQGLDIDLFSTSFFVSRETIVPLARRGLRHWRDSLFATLAHNASRVVEYYRIPDNAVIELGSRVRV